MKHSIWKYELDPNITIIRMPVEAKVLHIAGQGDSLCLWAKVCVEENILRETRKFVVFTTGEKFELTNTMQYLGTGTVPGFGSSLLVFHVYEEMALTGSELRKSKEEQL